MDHMKGATRALAITALAMAGILALAAYRSPAPAQSPGAAIAGDAATSAITSEEVAKAFGVALLAQLTGRPGAVGLMVETWIDIRPSARRGLADVEITCTVLRKDGSAIGEVRSRAQIPVARLGPESPTWLVAAEVIAGGVLKMVPAAGVDGV